MAPRARYLTTASPIGIVLGALDRGRSRISTATTLTAAVTHVLPDSATYIRRSAAKQEQSMATLVVFEFPSEGPWGQQMPEAYRDLADEIAREPDLCGRVGNL